MLMMKKLLSKSGCTLAAAILTLGFLATTAAAEGNTLAANEPNIEDGVLVLNQNNFESTIK
jgi:hypothetical protein